MINEVEAVIDAQKIQAALATDGAELGIAPEFRRLQPQFDIHVFESLPSTSTQLWEMLASGAKAGSVAIAQQQSAGRGQRGRIWQSAPGGLYLSLALEPDWPVTYSAQLTCLSAWGIATAFNNLGIPIEIKWPNDLFFKGKKLGGILTETKLTQAEPPSPFPLSSPSPVPKPLPRIKQAVIGIGINWQNPVPETGITLASILASHPELYSQNRIDCLEMLAALVLKGTLQGTFFRQQVGSQVFMKAYASLLTQIGNFISLDRSLLALATANAPWDSDLANKQVTDDLTNGQFKNCSGEVVGISEEGYLQVAMHGSSPNPSSERPLRHSGDILLLKPSEIHRE